MQVLTSNAYCDGRWQGSPFCSARGGQCTDEASIVAAALSACCYVVLVEQTAFVCVRC